MLSEDHILPKTMYQATKILSALKMPYEQIHSCPNGCILFRKEHEDETYCPKCKASRFLEVDAGDGQPKRQLTIPVKIIRYLPFIQRIQRLYMTEETAKQMTWHKKVFDTTPIRWCIPPRISHGLILMRFIMRKLKKLVMYVLRWQSMGLILMV